MTDLPTIDLLSWDSEFFGYPVARLSNTRVDAALLDEAFGWCRQQGVRCLYYLADAADAPSLHAAQGAGMLFVDVRITLARQLPHLLPSTRLAHSLRRARPEDQHHLLALAPALADVSRFGRDPHFGRKKATALYEKWLQKETAVTFIAETAATPLAGAIACDIAASNIGIISLLATHPQAKGQGVGNTLCVAGLHWMAAQNCTTAQVVTQGHNIPSQRLYQRNGFRTKSTEFWFHKWFKTNE